METKDQILTAATELFATFGYHKTTMDQIAKTANVAKGTLYWHFSSKKELLISIIKLDMKNWSSFLQRLKDDLQLTSSEKLEALIDHRISFFRHHSVIKEAMADEMHVKNGFPKKIRGIKESNLRLISDIFTQGVDRGEFEVEDPKIAALALMGMNLFIPRNRDLLFPETDQRIKEMIKKLIFHGVLKK